MMKNVWQWYRALPRWAIYVFDLVWIFATYLSVVALFAQQRNNELIIWLWSAAWLLYSVAKLVDLIAHAQDGIQTQNIKPRDSHIIEKHNSTNLKWLFLGLLGLFVLIVLCYWIAQNLPANVNGWSAFFTAFGAIGAWITGIALAFFAYYQWRIHQLEYTVIYNPRPHLISGIDPKLGSARRNGISYPYRIEWTVLASSYSTLPVFIHYVECELRLAGNGGGKHAVWSPKDCHILYPLNNTLSLPFQVTAACPQSIQVLIEGPSAGDTFDYVSRGSGSRDFELILKVFYSGLQRPDEHLVAEIVSACVYIPVQARWGVAMPYLD
jgi:hypothetical protein